MTEPQEPVPNSEQDQWPVEPVDEAPVEDSGSLADADRVEVRETGDRDDPEPSGREGLAGR